MSGRRVAAGVRRRLRRESDGALFDIDERRRIGMDELRDDVRAGRFFRAVRGSTGEDCTQEVLAQVIVTTVPSAAPDGGGFGAVMTALIGGMVAGSTRIRDELEDRSESPKRRSVARPADRHDWWEGD